MSNKNTRASKLPVKELTKLPTTHEVDAVGSLWNQTYEEIEQNLNALDQRAQDSDEQLASITAKIDGAEEPADVIEAIIAQIGGITGSLNDLASPVAIQSAVGLDWLYRGRRISFELFAAGYELRNHRGVTIRSGISGDDSIDVESTAGINPGEDYILYDGEETAIVRVASVLTENRLRLDGNLSRAWEPGTILTGSTFVEAAGGGVTGRVGDKWVSRAINLGDDRTARSVVIRRVMNAGEVRLFFRDNYTKQWTEAFWSVRRAGGGTTGVPADMADYEYVIGMRGDGYIRVEIEGEEVGIKHIVGLGAGTDLGGFVNPQMRPAKPSIINPANGDTEVSETPTITIGGFSSPAGNEFAHARILLSLSSNFNTILHDTGKILGLTYSVPAGIIPENTVIYQTVEVTDVAGLVSDRSDVTSFTSKETYAYVNTPAILSPVNGQTELPEQPTIQISAFATTGASDTHEGTQVQIRKIGDSWDDPICDSGLMAGGTSFTPQPGNIPAGEERLVIRGRHKGTELGFSEWSADVTVTTKKMFAQMIGIVRMSTGGGAGTWVRVNEKFEVIATDAATFNNHPIYAGITPQTIDEQSMIKIPAYYYKAGIIPPPYALAGLPFMFVSDQMAEGFSLHPAFMLNGNELPQYWVGKYQGSADGSKLASKKGVKPLVSIDFPTMQSRAAARNVGGVSGFQLWDVYQLSAIKLLALIEMGGPDSQSLIGQGHVSGSAAENVDGTNTSQATWRGIVGLWGNVWQMFDGLRTDANKEYEIWDLPGNRSYIKTGQVAPATNWVTEMSDAKGDDFDLAAMFLASATDGTEKNGTYGDYFYSNANCVAYHGGRWGRGSGAGLFDLRVGHAASHSNAAVGGRLAKV